jgi:hypothetical protein
VPPVEDVAGTETIGATPVVGLTGAAAVGDVVVPPGDVPVGDLICPKAAPVKAAPVPALNMRAVMRAARMECSHLLCIAVGRRSRERIASGEIHWPSL